MSNPEQYGRNSFIAKAGTTSYPPGTRYGTGVTSNGAARAGKRVIVHGIYSLAVAANATLQLVDGDGNSYTDYVFPAVTTAPTPFDDLHIVLENGLGATASAGADFLITYTVVGDA